VSRRLLHFSVASNLGCDCQLDQKTRVADLQEMRNWYVVHRRDKRLPPVAEAFKAFLLAEGAGLIAQVPAPH
jgi:hypothetical protein